MKLNLEVALLEVHSIKELRLGKVIARKTRAYILGFIDSFRSIKFNLDN